MDNIEQATIVDPITEAQNKISKGEKVRILWEILMDNLGLTYENPIRDVVNKLKETQESYNEGVNYFQQAITTQTKK